MKEYALYKGEEILAIGTIREIAKELNLSEYTVRFYQTPSWKKRRKKTSIDYNFKELVSLEFEEDENIK